MSTSPVLGTDPSKWPYPYNPAQGGLGLSLDSQQSLTNNQKDQGRANLDIWGKGSYQLCCDFNFNPSYAWQAGITSISVRQFHKAYRYLAGVRLTFVNFSAASGSNIETPTGNDVTHSGYLEYNGILYPIVFNEGVAASLTIPSGFMGHGFVNVDIPPGDQFSTRVYTTVPSTSSYIPTPCTLQATDSYTSGSDVTNATGAMATQAIGSNYPGPALITSAFSPGPSVIGFGDSIFQGSGDIRACPRRSRQR